MVRFFFVLVCGFVLGAVVIENKHYFSNEVPVPVAFLPDGGQYDGSFLKGELSGLGRIAWPNGDVYEGEFQQGLFNGVGRYQTEEQVYKGEFINGVATGKGKIEFANGNIYEGDVVDGKAHGQGLMILAEAEYIGDFLDNQFHGSGQLIRGNGDIYEGEFVDGKFSGQGTFKSREGEFYQGAFKEGEVHGQAEYRSGETRYTGDFVDGLFEGRGEYTDKNSIYIGEFHQGLFHGEGVYTQIDGLSYKGEFARGRFHGQGILEVEDERYEGSFEYGVRHGTGILTYAQPLDGINRIEGIWRLGVLQQSDNPLVEHTASYIVEDVLYHQKKRLEQLINSIKDNDQNLTEMYFVGIAGDGNQGVFRREVNFVRDLFDQDFGTKNKSALLINGNVSFQQQVPLATLTSIEDLLTGIADKMDAEKDILFLYLTSHGSQDFQFLLAQQGLELESLSAKHLGNLLHSLPVRYKVVVISACYSGGFVKPIKDDNTLVIVAAAADRTSFGCTDAAEMTYFGEAFFKDALPLSDSFVSAFERARDIVLGREASQGFEHSNPLIFKPSAISEHLLKWRQELTEWQQQQNEIIVSSE